MLIKKLNYLLESNKLNKRQFAEKSNIPYTTIDGIYKKGYENIKLSTLQKIANFFNVTLDYLIVDEILDVNYGKQKTYPINDSLLINRASQAVTEYKTTYQVQKDKLLSLFLELDEIDREKTLERIETFLDNEKYKTGYKLLDIK